MNTLRQTQSGSVLEGTVKSVFQKKKFEYVKYREWKKNPQKYGSELLLYNIPFETIYGHKGNTEFLLKSQKHEIEIRIECKWQQTSGSVDEKLPYLYLNAIEKMPEKDVIIIIDGKGWKKGAIEWLREAVDRKKYTTLLNKRKMISVMNLAEFITWANKVFR